MNYYRRHLGDYARDTGHLSALEHGIYTLLLDWYYINECPIPEAKAKRIARGNPEETQTVLEEFFILTPEGWRHARADREIEEYREKADANRERGKLGGRPKKTQTVSEQNPTVTLASSHKPLANSHKEDSLPPDGCPHAEIIAAYHAALPANPRIKAWTGTRQANLRTRWREDEKRQSLDYWQRFFAHVAASPFLTGQRTDRDGRPFLPGLDWLVKPDNFAKVIEGRYHDKGAAP